jgi:hypothetical protein
MIDDTRGIGGYWRYTGTAESERERPSVRSAKPDIVVCPPSRLAGVIRLHKWDSPWPQRHWILGQRTRPKGDGASEHRAITGGQDEGGTLVSGNSGGFQLSQAVGQGGEDTLPTSMSLHTLG